MAKKDKAKTKATGEARAERLDDALFLRDRVKYLSEELIKVIEDLGELKEVNGVYVQIAITHARQAALWALKTKNLSTGESEPTAENS